MILVNAASDGAPAPLPDWFHDASVVDRHVRRAEQAAALAESTLAEPLDDIAFDDVTALVRELLAVPASFVVLLGGDEDAVKSQCDARGVNQGERVLRGRSFCHYVAVAGQALVIDDTLAHAPWRDVPIVAGLNVRAYIGMPLWQGDVVLGTLCAIDHVPRRWTPRDRRCMTQLATSLQREMDLRRDRRQARLLARARELQLMAARAAMRDPLAALSLCALQLQRQGTGATDAPGHTLHRRVAGALDGLRQVSQGLLTDLVHPAQGTADDGASPIDELLTAAIEIVSSLDANAPVRLRRLAPDLEPWATARSSLNHAELLRLLCHVQAALLEALPGGTALTVALQPHAGGWQLTWARDPHASAEPMGPVDHDELHAHARAVGAVWQGRADGGLLHLPAVSRPGA